MEKWLKRKGLKKANNRYLCVGEKKTRKRSERCKDGGETHEKQENFAYTIDVRQKGSST